MRITDENDPFFVYSLGIGDDDFQGSATYLARCFICLQVLCRLKSQQGLLVDFTAFPQKFIDLLELCLAESGKDRPKYIQHTHHVHIKVNMHCFTDFCYIWQPVQVTELMPC